MRRTRAASATVLATALAVVLLPATAAGAHPLGNFTVNHSDALLLTPDGVTLRAVVDRAEIPTAQALQDIAPDGDPAPGTLAAVAATDCGSLAAEVSLTVDDDRLGWRTEDTALEVVPGTAGLPTLRLTCTLRADADLTGRSSVVFRADHRTDQVGWREITADGEGVRLIDSPVPVESPSDELRDYPDDLLESPLDVRVLEVTTEPGENTGPVAGTTPASGDPFADALAGLDRRLTDLVGTDGLTPLVGVLALGLAVLLGCGHALLPGHGKTVMAAYLAGRRGRPRDAVTVGVTVTATHTAGVLLLGLAVSLSSAFAGDQVLRWLGVLSGALVAAIGAFMLRSALRGGDAVVPHAAPAPAVARVPALAGPAGRQGTVEVPLRPHDAPHEHEHEHEHEHGHRGRVSAWWAGSHHHGAGHTHGPGRGGLVGMGIAGGLVPSPSALLVLLASVALGRTLFGVLLVVAYGLGMAATLTAVGLALVRVRDRLAGRLSQNGTSAALRLVSRAAPVITAALVLVVGSALVVRGIVLGN